MTTPPTATPRLLVIDDDEAILMLCRRILADYDVETAATGEAGVESYKSHPFDAVISDISLPGIDGFEVVRRIRQFDPAARVLFMTGHDLQDKMIESLRENVVDFVPKPFDLEDFKTAVASVLSSDADIQVISAQPHWIELRVPASFQAVSRLGKFFERLHAEIDTNTRNSISTAFRELLNNAIEHGCEGDASGRVSVCYLRLSRVILYRIADPGRGFKAEELKHAAINNPPEDPLHHIEIRQRKGLRPGGFGILCAKGIADELIYNEKGNEVVFARYLDRPHPDD